MIQVSSKYLKKEKSHLIRLAHFSPRQEELGKEEKSLSLLIRKGFLHAQECDEQLVKYKRHMINTVPGYPEW